MRRLSFLKTAVYKALDVADKIFPRRYAEVRSEIPLSVVIPTHPKDLDLAEICIQCLRKNLRHPLEGIYVVSPPSDEARSFCERVGEKGDVHYINEKESYPFTHDEVKAEFARFQARTAPSWLFQQLLKLNCDAVTENEHVLILDADTMLLRPRIFFDGQTLFQDFSHENNPMYYMTHERLTGQRVRPLFSFVCHHMFAQRSILQALRARIEEQTGMGWWRAIIDAQRDEHWPGKYLNREGPFNYFSEYETYIHFALGRYEKVKKEYFFNFNAKDLELESQEIPEHLRTLCSYFKWASYHRHLNSAMEQRARQAIRENS